MHIFRNEKAFILKFAQCDEGMAYVNGIVERN